MAFSRFPIPLAFAALLLSAPAYADSGEGDGHGEEDGGGESGSCSGLTVIPAGGATIAQYDALLAGDFIAPMQIEIRNDSSKSCSGTISFDSRRSARALVGPQGGRLAYLIVAESNGNDVIFDPETGSGRSIAFTVARRSSRTLRPQLRVNGGQSGASGRYEATIDIALAAGGDEHEDDLHRTSAVLAANVVPSVQANFIGTDAGSGSVATMSLGELVTGLERSIGMQIRANADVDLTISSENHGKLNRIGGGGAVPYDLTFGHQRIDLEQTDSVRVRLGEDSVRGLRQAIDVKIGDTSRQQAGNYRDTVTFRISGR